MNTYLAIAYRWGNSNEHQYTVYCGPDESKALALAENEQLGRGGKYGVAVYATADTDGENLQQHAYYPCRKEEEPEHNWRIDYFERLGHILEELIEGRQLSVPNEQPDENGLTCMHRVEIPVHPVLRQEVERHRHMFERMQEARDKARTEQRERSLRIFCPVCDCTPVYNVEYTCSFWRVARQEDSGTIEIDGLEGTYCRACGTLHQTSGQITRNHLKIWTARNKAETAELDE